jgi:peptidase M23-like protein
VRWNVLLAAVVALGAAAVLVTTEAPIDDPVWWYVNSTPPRLSIDGPGGPLRGNVEGTVALDPADRARVVSVSVDGQPLPIDGTHVEVDSTRLPDGRHQVDVVARDTSRHQNQSTASWSFVSDNTPPRLDVTAEPAEGPREGHTWLLRIRPDEAIAHLEGTIGDHPLELQSDGGGGYWAVEGVPPDPPYTSVSIRLTASDTLGNSGSMQKSWDVQKTTFPEDDELSIDPNTVAQAARDQENAQLGTIYAQDDGPKHWDGAFRLPVQGPITTDFGTHRPYEYHPGTDFGVGLGTPVSAPARGIVVFEGMVPARGNVLVLDHGAGVYSTYAHLQRFAVEPGADVTPGETIAMVGSTGFSTGPHLHWELWVDGANVDPIDWTQRSFP